MKKSLLLLAGVAVAIAVLVTAIVSLIWLTSSNQITFDIGNDSKTVLRNVKLVTPGIDESPMDLATRGEDLAPGWSDVCAIRARRKVAFRLLFDANGQHYELPAEVRALPFGLWTVRVRIDEHMQMSVKLNGTFRA